MESTQKEPEETIQEIMILLRDYKVRDVLTNYNDSGNISAVSFRVIVNDQLVPFKLPANHIPLWNLAKNKKTKYIRTEDQARRVAWRQVYKWIQSQLAMIDIGMVKFEQVFMPYILIKHDQTIYDHFIEQGNFSKLLGSGEPKKHNGK
ncbi:MAG TPA: hypothetical protein VMV56_07705 [Williamwhitmania sp.]|nr:hypothetical protein [Williamwhitmania sp.]